ncbi:hypothetical protein FJ366_01825 [Candidatus Dependentiae bacterium]|nr:hypothetical protein [Candidatus Dependentiae bacterium]
MTLSPSTLRFIVHPAGEVIAAQEIAGDSTQLTFFQYEQATPEGRSAVLNRLCSVPDESAQGINWGWTHSKLLFATSSNSGKFSIYKIEPTEDNSSATAIKIIEEEQGEQAVLIAWNNNNDIIALATSTHIKMYVFDEESELPLRCVFSKKHDLTNVKFLGWSSNDLYLSLGNKKTLLLWQTRNQSGILKLTPYINKRIDQTLSQASVGDIKDIAWGKSSSQSIAILGKKMIVINIPELNPEFPRIIQNIAPSVLSFIAWNQTPSSMGEKQEVIATTKTGIEYRVYTVTDNSLSYNSTPHSLLPPSSPEESNPLQQFSTVPATTHIVADATEVELVNKLIAAKN